MQLAVAPFIIVVPNESIREMITVVHEGTTMTGQQDCLTLDMPIPEVLTGLEMHIQSRLNGRVRHLRLSVRDDGLVLEGHTHTYYAKLLAQHAVMEATDLPILANEIEVS